MSTDPEHVGEESLWLYILAVIAMIALVVTTILSVLDMPQVYINPDGDCVDVIYPSSDNRVGHGDCGMLPEMYDEVPVPFTYGTDD